MGWKQYLIMLGVIAAIIAFISHCFLLPFIVPMAQSFLLGTNVAGHLPLIITGMNILFSMTVGALLLQRIEHRLTANPEAPPRPPMQASQVPPAHDDTQQPAPGNQHFIPNPPYPDEPNDPPRQDRRRRFVAN